MKKLLILLIPILLLSCNSIYNEKNENVFGDLMWTKGEKVHFGPINIEDTNAKYELKLTASHYNRLGIEKLPIYLRIKSPNKLDTLFHNTLIFTTPKGESITECSGDYCDLTQTLETDYEFKEKGDYNVWIQQPHELVKGITSLRLDVVKKD